MPQLGGDGGCGPVPAATWLIGRPTPPTVIVPLRATPVFWETATLTVPSLEPETGGVRLIQPALADAIHVHPPGAATVTVTVAAPPAAENWPLLIAA